MIPTSNVSNLMLNRKSGCSGERQVPYLVGHSIEEGIEVLTGSPAGKNEDGSFKSNGIFSKVDQRLARMADELAKLRTEVITGPVK